MNVLAVIYVLALTIVFGALLANHGSIKGPWAFWTCVILLAAGLAMSIHTLTRLHA